MNEESGMEEMFTRGRAASSSVPLRLLLGMHQSDGWFWPVSGDATTKGKLYDEPSDFEWGDQAGAVL